MRISGYVVGAIFLALGVYVIVTYNTLVKKEEAYKKSWSAVQGVYQRRLDLIPNLVSVVRGQSDFEQTTLQKVIEARSNANSIISNSNLNSNNLAQDNLATETNKLIVSLEKYPDLKGTDAYRKLQVDLDGSERRIKFERKKMNDAVQDYNTTARNFPTSIIAKIFGFKVLEGFQAEGQEAVQIKF